jgi:hypothetical protein
MWWPIVGSLALVGGLALARSWWDRRARRREQLDRDELARRVGG